jgi:hypothetical protein
MGRPMKRRRPISYHNLIKRSVAQIHLATAVGNGLPNAGVPQYRILATYE